MKLDKRIIILLIIIVALCIGIAYELYAHQDTKNEVKNITMNNTTVKNST